MKSLDEHNQRNAKGYAALRGRNGAPCAAGAARMLALRRVGELAALNPDAWVTDAEELKACLFG